MGNAAQCRCHEDEHDVDGDVFGNAMVFLNIYDLNEEWLQSNHISKDLLNIGGAFHAGVEVGLFTPSKNSYLYLSRPGAWQGVVLRRGRYFLPSPQGARGACLPHLHPNGNNMLLGSPAEALDAAGNGSAVA